MTGDVLMIPSTSDHDNFRYLSRIGDYQNYENFIKVDISPIVRITCSESRIAALADDRVYYWGIPLFNEDEDLRFVLEIRCRDIKMKGSDLYFTTEEGLYLADKHLDGNFEIKEIYPYADETVEFDN